jgi:hypothetical protein
MIIEHRCLHELSSAALRSYQLEISDPWLKRYMHGRFLFLACASGGYMLLQAAALLNPDN